MCVLNLLYASAASACGVTTLLLLLHIRSRCLWSGVVGQVVEHQHQPVASRGSRQRVRGIIDATERALVRRFNSKPLFYLVIPEISRPSCCCYVPTHTHTRPVLRFSLGSAFHTHNTRTTYHVRRQREVSQPMEVVHGGGGGGVPICTAAGTVVVDGGRYVCVCCVCAPSWQKKPASSLLLPAATTTTTAPPPSAAVKKTF